RVGFFVVSLIIAAFVAWTSESGKRFIGFARDSYTEVRRVHWPQRKEATQMTGIVFAFVVVMAVLLWLIDKGLEWIIYGLFLGVWFFVVSLIIAAFVAWTSESGKRFIGFARDSYTEVRRVHWPQRKEATQMTGIVFAFVVVMAVLLWLIDKGLEWIIYGLFLGWK